MTETNTITRGIRNHNPLNIRISADNNWQGRVPLEENTDKVFEQFLTPVWGIRAAARLVIGKFDKYGIKTIRQLIEGKVLKKGGKPEEGWAPASENDTAAYIRNVATWSGIDADQELDFHTHDPLASVLKAMIREENGVPGQAWVFPYSDVQMDAALNQAGVPPTSQKPLHKTPTIQGAQISAASATATTAIQVVQDTITNVTPTLQGLSQYLDAAKYALLALTLLGVGIVVWRAMDLRRKGVV